MKGKLCEESCWAFPNVKIKELLIRQMTSEQRRPDRSTKRYCDATLLLEDIFYCALCSQSPQKISSTRIDRRHTWPRVAMTSADDATTAGWRRRNFFASNSWFLSSLLNDPRNIETNTYTTAQRVSLYDIWKTTQGASEPRERDG